MNAIKIKLVISLKIDLYLFILRAFIIALNRNFSKTIYDFESEVFYENSNQKYITFLGKIIQ